jgi:hypothetical protein
MEGMLDMMETYNLNPFELYALVFMYTQFDSVSFFDLFS